MAPPANQPFSHIQLVQQTSAVTHDASADQPTFNNFSLAQDLEASDSRVLLGGSSSVARSADSLATNNQGATFAAKARAAELQAARTRRELKARSGNITGSQGLAHETMVLKRTKWKRLDLSEIPDVPEILEPRPAPLQSEPEQDAGSDDVHEMVGNVEEDSNFETEPSAKGKGKLRQYVEVPQPDDTLSDDNKLPGHGGHDQDWESTENDGRTESFPPYEEPPRGRLAREPLFNPSSGYPNLYRPEESPQISLDPLPVLRGASLAMKEEARYLERKQERELSALHDIANQPQTGQYADFLPSNSQMAYNTNTKADSSREGAVRGTASPFHQMPSNSGGRKSDEKHGDEFLMRGAEYSLRPLREIMGSEQRGLPGLIQPRQQKTYPAVKGTIGSNVPIPHRNLVSRQANHGGSRGIQAPPGLGQHFSPDESMASAPRPPPGFGNIEERPSGRLGLLSPYNIAEQNKPFNLSRSASASASASVEDEDPFTSHNPEAALLARIRRGNLDSYALGSSSNFASSSTSTMRPLLLQQPVQPKPVRTLGNLASDIDYASSRTVIRDPEVTGRHSNLSPYPMGSEATTQDLVPNTDVFAPPPPKPVEWGTPENPLVSHQALISAHKLAEFSRSRKGRNLEIIRERSSAEAWWAADTRFDKSTEQQCVHAIRNLRSTRSERLAADQQALRQASFSDEVSPEIPSDPTDDLTEDSARIRDRQDFVTHIMVPLLLNLKSYQSAPGYFNRFRAAPAWSIDQGEKASQSFFGSDWGAPPARVGRDPRYQPVQQQQQAPYDHNSIGGRYSNDSSSIGGRYSDHGSAISGRYPTHRSPWQAADNYATRRAGPQPYPPQFPRGW